MSWQYILHFNKLITMSSTHLELQKQKKNKASFISVLCNVIIIDMYFIEELLFLLHESVHWGLIL